MMQGSGLRLVHEQDTELAVHRAEQPLLRYVYRPHEAQLESPRPYFHPLHTLDGDLVSLYRPHDHVWHKGIAWSLPNVDAPDHNANFWGGPTYRRGKGYQQLDNDGSMRHIDFERLDVDADQVTVTHRLEWLTEPGTRWLTERRGFQVRTDPASGTWTLLFDTILTNVSGQTLTFGSPTTQGRDNAGYGGLFWRGPRSFSGGRVYTPEGMGSDELMGVRASWMGYAGRHDGHGRWSSLVFVDGSGDPSSSKADPTQWFVRTDVYACVCPAPFFDAEMPLDPEGSRRFRYAVVIADGDSGADGAGRLADGARGALREFEA